VKADPDQRQYYIRVAMGKRRADRDRVCTKAVVERGDVESPRKGPLVVKSVEVMKQNSNVGYLKSYLASGGSSFLPTSRIWTWRSPKVLWIWSSRVMR